MNKKLIAMAVAAGLAAPMAAQAGVTPYGALQIEIAQYKNDGYGENNTKNSRTGTAANETAIKVADNKRGRLGFKIKEDLGGGLNAIAKFEWQVDTAYGNINDGARESWVGMKGGFGEIKAGRIKSSYKYTGGVKYDPFVTTYLEARKSGGMLGGAWGQNSFWNTSLSYKNKWGGFSLWANLGMDQGDGTTDYMADTTKEGAKDAPGQTGDYSIAGKFGGKIWEVFLVTEMNAVASNAASAAGTKQSWSANKIGGKVKFAGAHTISGQYEMIKDKTKSTDQNTKIAFIGYQFKMGKNIIAAQGGLTNPDGSDNDTTYMAVGFIHKFSKKTRVFAGYRSSKTKTTSTDNKATAISVGMRVAF